jgi:hypothetical protein
MTEETGSVRHKANTPLVWVPALAVGLTVLTWPESSSKNDADTTATASETFTNSLTAGMNQAVHGKDFPVRNFSLTGNLATKFTFIDAREAALDAMDVDHNDVRNRALAGCAVAATVDLHNRITPEAANAFNTGQFETADAACKQAVNDALSTHKIDHIYAPTGLVTG